MAMDLHQKNRNVASHDKNKTDPFHSVIQKTAFRKAP